MCEFFSFVTEPEYYAGQRFYFNWEYRKDYPYDGNDSHSHICAHYRLNEDICNKYEFNPLTKQFKKDNINSRINDCLQAEDWVNNLDFGKIVEPLIIKPIINPFEIPAPELTSEDIEDFKKWALVVASAGTSIWALVGASFRASFRDSVCDLIWALVAGSVWDLVWGSVWDLVWGSIRASVEASVWDSVNASIEDSIYGYVSSFFRIPYKYDFSSVVRLWERGIVPSFDGRTWRLHAGEDAHVIYTMGSEK